MIDENMKNRILEYIETLRTDREVFIYLHFLFYSKILVGFLDNKINEFELSKRLYEERYLTEKE